MTMTTDSRQEAKSFTDDFIRRVKANRKTRWIRFALVSLLFFSMGGMARKLVGAYLLVSSI